jgi:uroporphyrinogen decarboxylase
MTRREVVFETLAFRRPSYVPWAWDMTQICEQRVREYLGTDDPTDFIDSHFLDTGPTVRQFEKIAEYMYRDVYGVIWDRSIDKDIGTPCEWPIKRPEDLDNYEWPDSGDDSWYKGIPEQMASCPDLFIRYQVDFSLFERAWTMRGMSGLLMDMIERPEFVERLLDAIVEHDLLQIERALSFGVDAIHFGDDYGSQRGLIMGVKHWRRFFKPRLARMFAPIRDAGKFVFLHSCGCVAELFDDLIEVGLNVFNPFQPEVMDIFAIKKQFQGRLAFHGGMSIQKVLPFGSVDDVRRETRRLIEAGREGGYVFSPSHSVPSDVPPANLVAMMEELRGQEGAPV